MARLPCRRWRVGVATPGDLFCDRTCRVRHSLAPDIPRRPDRLARPNRHIGDGAFVLWRHHMDQRHRRLAMVVSAQRCRRGLCISSPDLVKRRDRVAYPSIPFDNGMVPKAPPRRAHAKAAGAREQFDTCRQGAHGASSHQYRGGAHAPSRIARPASDRDHSSDLSLFDHSSSSSDGCSWIRATIRCALATSSGGGSLFI